MLEVIEVMAEEALGVEQELKGKDKCIGEVDEPILKGTR